MPPLALSCNQQPKTLDEKAAEQSVQGNFNYQNLLMKLSVYYPENDIYPLWILLGLATFRMIDLMGEPCTLQDLSASQA